MTNTTISISCEVKEVIENLKTHPRETYNEVLQRELKWVSK